MISRSLPFKETQIININLLIIKRKTIIMNNENGKLHPGK